MDSGVLVVDLGDHQADDHAGNDTAHLDPRDIMHGADEIGSDADGVAGSHGGGVAGNEHRAEHGNAEGGGQVTEHGVGTGAGAGDLRVEAGQGDVHEDGAVAAEAEADKEQAGREDNEAGLSGVEQLYSSAYQAEHQSKGRDVAGLLLAGERGHGDVADGHADVQYAGGVVADGAGGVEDHGEADGVGHAGLHKTLGEEENDDRQDELLAGHELAVEDGVLGLLLSEDQDHKAHNGSGDDDESGLAEPAGLTLSEVGNAESQGEEQDDEDSAEYIKTGEALLRAGLLGHGEQADDEAGSSQDSADVEDDAVVLGGLDYDAADGGSKDDHAAGQSHVNGETGTHLGRRELTGYVSDNGRGNSGSADAYNEAEKDGHPHGTVGREAEAKLADDHNGHTEKSSAAAAKDVAQLTEDRRAGGHAHAHREGDPSQPGIVKSPGADDVVGDGSREAAGQADQRRGHCERHKALLVVFVYSSIHTFSPS